MEAAIKDSAIDVRKKVRAMAEIRYLAVDCQYF